MKASPEHLVIIRSVIEQSLLTSPTLKDDVVDHLCCMVEDKMASGKIFDMALQEALFEFAPAGLNEIQFETDFLLYTNKFLAMKKLTYAIGLTTSISIAMGLMMKLLHMPGGEELVNYGFFGFALLFLPMVTISRYKANPTLERNEKLKIVFGFLSAVLTGLAVFFKIKMQLEASEVLLITGASIFSFGFLPVVFYTMYKKSASYRMSE